MPDLKKKAGSWPLMHILSLSSVFLTFSNCSNPNKKGDKSDWKFGWKLIRLRRLFALPRVEEKKNLNVKCGSKVAVNMYQTETGLPIWTNFGKHCDHRNLQGLLCFNFFPSFCCLGCVLVSWQILLLLLILNVHYIVIMVLKENRKLRFPLCTNVDCIDNLQ